MAPGVLLEPYMSQGGQGLAETPIVSKGLKLRQMPITKTVIWMPEVIVIIQP